MFQALLTPGVFSSWHFLPYIFLEWSEIAGSDQATLCPDLTSLVMLLRSEGYNPRDANTLGQLPDHCLHHPVYDVLWVHRDAAPLWEEDSVVQCSFQE